MTIIRTRAQEAVVRIWQETLKQIRADVLVQEACGLEDGRLRLGGHTYDLSAIDRVMVLGAGKASSAMARAIDEMLPTVRVEGLVVTKYGHALAPGRIETIESAHPIPDQNSLAAGIRMLQLAQSASERDLVVVLISGGASSLMELPIEGLTMREVQMVTESLLRSGADIEELNTVRSCLSQIKAGGLVRDCRAEVVCLLLSDVIGNAREIVGSGPCWGSPPSGRSALSILERRRVPVHLDLEDALGKERRLKFVDRPHVVVGDIYTLLERAEQAAKSLGFRPRVLSRPFTGEAREFGARIGAQAHFFQSGEADCLIAAGETTVTVSGNGRGGRNQELACSAAIAMEDALDVALLAIGTDGTDGPTDAAGGLVDGTTSLRTNLRRALDENDCYPALDAADALLITGPTQTNLNDLVLVARVPEG